MLSSNEVIWTVPAVHVLHIRDPTGKVAQHDAQVASYHQITAFFECLTLQQISWVSVKSSVWSQQLKFT